MKLFKSEKAKRNLKRAFFVVGLCALSYFAFMQLAVIFELPNEVTNPIAEIDHFFLTGCDSDNDVCELNIIVVENPDWFNTAIGSIDVSYRYFIDDPYGLQPFGELVTQSAGKGDVTIILPLEDLPPGEHKITLQWQSSLFGPVFLLEHIKIVLP